jgi:CubicO group peptidase (beta-lactamase class C family)
MGRRPLSPALATGIAALYLAVATPFLRAAPDDLIRAAMKQWHVPGVAVVIVQDNRIVYLKGFGVRELGGKEPVTPDTVFPIASNTKAFTTLAMAMLVDDGKMTWDDPARKHLPAFRLADPLANEQVTLRDLVTHRTGVAGHDYLMYRAPWNIDEQIRRIGLVKPSHPFRSTYEYQSILFAAAGRAVAAASGIKWETFIRKRIFEPLEMKTASCTTAEAFQRMDRISGTRWDRTNKLEVVPWYDFREPNPTGSICASATDLGQWLRFQLGDGSWGNDRLVSQRNLEETHTPQIVLRLEGLPRKEQPFTIQMSYGMGWVIQDYRGHRIIMHGGSIDGIRTHIALAPDDHTGIAILCNLQWTRMNLALSYSLFDELFGLAPHDWNAHYQSCVRETIAEDHARQRKLQATRHEGTKPTREPAAYAGHYEEPAYGSAEVLVEKDTLVLKWSSFQSLLEHFHFDTFTMANDVLHRPQLTFRLGSNGEVVGLRFLDMEFKKAKASR